MEKKQEHRVSLGTLAWSRDAHTWLQLKQERRRHDGVPGAPSLGDFLPK